MSTATAPNPSWNRRVAREDWPREGLSLLQAAATEAVAVFDGSASASKVIPRFLRIEVEVVRWSRRVPSPGIHVEDEAFAATILRCVTDLRHAVANLARAGMPRALTDAAGVLGDLVAAATQPSALESRGQAEAALTAWEAEKRVGSLALDLRRPVLDAFRCLASLPRVAVASVGATLPTASRPPHDPHDRHK